LLFSVFPTIPENMLTGNWPNAFCGGVAIPF
jgi:hypothetical protein